MFIWINLLLPVALAFNITCPELLQRTIRSEYVCNETSQQQYSCLFDEHNQSFVESCADPDFVRSGQKYIVSGLRRNTDCSSKRYQPFKFWSNTSSQCVFKKSKCNEIGQTFVDNDSTKKDTECRCDYTKGFGFIVKPKNTCVCIPSKEDCTCYSVSCPLNYTLTADYNCQPETIFKQITLCSEFDLSRNDKEIINQNLNSDSKKIQKNISNPSERNLGILTSFFAIAIAYIVGVTIGGCWILLKRSEQESLYAITEDKIEQAHYKPVKANITEKNQQVDYLKVELKKFENELLDWLKETLSVIETLLFLAEELDVYFLRIIKTKIRGSTAGIVGSVLGIVGLSLSPTTFGESLRLSIAGGIIGGIGGATCTFGGSFIADNVLLKQSRRKANEKLKGYSAASKLTKTRCLELSLRLQTVPSLHLQNVEKVEDRFPEWVNFWFLVANGQDESGTKEQKWDDIEAIIQTSLSNILSTARILGPGMGAGIRITGAAAKITETSFIGALMIPLDIHTLVTSAIDLHNKHETFSLIYKLSKAIESELPKEDGIHKMIDSTLRRL